MNDIERQDNKLVTACLLGFLASAMRLHPRQPYAS
jgi:hypothetical protein